MIPIELGKITNKRYYRSLVKDPQVLEQVEGEIAALWLPDVRFMADYIHNSVREVEVSGKQRRLLFVVGPGHGYGKSYIAKPLLRETVSQELPEVPFETISSIKAAEIDYGFRKNGRYVYVVDESLSVKPVSDTLVESIEDKTAALVHFTPSANNNQMRQEMAFEEAEALRAQGLTVDMYSPQMRGVPVDLATTFVNCFQLDDDYSTLIHSLLRQMSTIKPQFLSDVVDWKNIDHFREDMINRAPHHRSRLTTADLPLFRRLLNIPENKLLLHIVD